MSFFALGRLIQDVTDIEVIGASILATIETAEFIHLFGTPENNFSFNFPNATGLEDGIAYEIYNATNRVCTVNDGDLNQITQIRPGDIKKVTYLDTSTSAGTYFVSQDTVEIFRNDTFQGTAQEFNFSNDFFTVVGGNLRGNIEPSFSREALAGTALDFGTHNLKVLTKTLTQDETFTFTNAKAGRIICLELTGEFVPTFPSEFLAVNTGIYNGAQTNTYYILCVNDTLSSEKFHVTIGQERALP